LRYYVIRHPGEAATMYGNISQGETGNWAAPVKDGKIIAPGRALQVGKIYRLKFPGFAARAIEPPCGGKAGNYPFLVESLFLRGRWYVNERGEPDNISSPALIVRAPDHRSLSIRNILAGPVYFVAFVFHLLCAGLTVFAAKIAGHPH
jgi:hypothetical protein